MKERSKLGAAIALIGAILGIVVIYASFLQVYDPIMASEIAAGRAGGESITDGLSVSKYVMPVVNDIGILGGVIWAVAAFGFIKKEDWAWSTAILANVLSLLSFFMLIPALSRGISAIYAVVFIPNLIAFFLLLTCVRKIDSRIIAISMLAGMAYVMAFMNGVAATDQMLSGVSSGSTIFIVGQRLNWIASIAWGSFVVALLTRKKWALRLGLAAALLTLVAGIPLGVVTAMQSAKFSMYFLAPFLALILKIIFVLPRGNTILTLWIDAAQEPV
jgi:hypothetical protein